MERKRGSISSPRARKRGKRGKEKADDVKSHKLGPCFSDLPFPITTDILLRLPIKSVLICKRVCKTWNTLISDPHFAKLHFKQSRFGFMIRTCDPKLVSRTMYLLEDEPQELDSKCNDILKLQPTFKLPLRDAKLVLDKQDGTDGLLACWPDDHKFDVVNSCNGLICLCGPFNNDPLVVCNPVTGEFIRLPKVIRNKYNTLFSGIGFQPSTNEYKVVKIEYDSMNVEINVVGTPTWRNVRISPTILGHWRSEHPTFVNEALHWIIFDGKRCSILRFNFETEKLQLIFLPSHPFFQNTYLHKGISMGALRDSLYVCNATLPSSVDVWIMKDYDSSKVKWSKAFTFRREPYSGISVHWPICWPVNHFEKGTAMLEYCSKAGFTYYYPKNNRPYKFLVCGTQEKTLKVIPHIPSLISLKDVVKGDNAEVLNIHSRCAKFKLLGE